MITKKITAVLLAVGVIASTTTLFSEINIKGAFADTIQQNVVYAKGDTTSASIDNTKLSDADNKEIKEKSLDAAKKYFGASIDTDASFQYRSSLMNEATLIDEEAKEQKMLQEEYDKKEITAEEYNTEKEYIPKSVNASRAMIAKLKHGVITATWINANGNGYNLSFNENTKEIESIQEVTAMNDGLAKRTKLTLSEDQLKSTAENFIKEYKLGDLQKPKCILVKDQEYFYQVFYQDENDSSKKVGVYIDSYTGKVSCFVTKSSADLYYDNAINLK
jgi:hypothetical protein